MPPWSACGCIICIIFVRWIMFYIHPKFDVFTQRSFLSRSIFVDSPTTPRSNSHHHDDSTFCLAERRRPPRSFRRSGVETPHFPLCGSYQPEHCGWTSSGKFCPEHMNGLPAIVLYLILYLTMSVFPSHAGVQPFDPHQPCSPNELLSHGQQNPSCLHHWRYSQLF